MEHAVTDNRQGRFARLAGLLFLLEIIGALGSGFLLSHIATGKTFAETGTSIAASEHLYRAALSIVLLVTLSSAVLAFALYATLRPVNHWLAQLAMIFSLGDSFLGMVVRTCSFVRVPLYASSQGSAGGTISAETLSNLMRSIAATTENIGGISFGLGSLLFFYLFFKSNYLPRALSGLGLVASILWTCLYFASLIFPERHALLQYICFPPLALADLTTGLYLMLFAVKAAGPMAVRRSSTLRKPRAE